MKNRLKKGFTLIELLVVISIIGVLATIVMASLSNAQAHARDARRKSDIKTIQKALEMYYLDHGHYPTTSNLYSYNSSWQSNLGNALGITLPVDPINENLAPQSGGYSYRYFAHPSSGYCSGQAYFLNYNLETETGNGADDGVTLCNGYHYTYGNSFVVGMDKDGNLN